METVRGVGQLVAVVVLGADHAVRADEAAIAALDAVVGVPHGDEVGDVALLVRRRSRRIGPVHRQGADRKRVAAAGHHLGGHRPHELGSIGRDQGRQFAGGRHLVRNLDAVQRFQGAVDDRLVTRDDVGAALAVGLRDRFLDAGDRLLGRQHTGDGEKARLQNGVGAPGEPRLPGEPAGVDGVDLEVLGQDLLLHRTGERVPDDVRRVAAVEQQGGARGGPAEHVHLIQQAELVAADEAGVDTR